MAGYFGNRAAEEAPNQRGTPRRSDSRTWWIREDAGRLAQRSGAAIIGVFVTRRADMERELASIRRRMAPAAGLWVAWPKKASQVSSDMTEDVVREIALPTGLVDNNV